MKLPLWHVDAFAGGACVGNPAGICLLDQWREPGFMQRIAAEINLPETALVVSAGSGGRIVGTPSENAVREPGLAAGLVNCKVRAIDAPWPGCFSRSAEARTLLESQGKPPVDVEHPAEIVEVAQRGQGKHAGSEAEPGGNGVGELEVRDDCS